MIKRTLYFGNPAYLSLKLRQLIIKLPDPKGDMPDFGVPDSFSAIKTIPIEDIGVVILDHQQITLSQGLIASLLESNCAVVTCDAKHMPTGLLLPLAGNTVQNERFRQQLEASLPLKKQLWQQTVIQKIKNQAAVLEYTTGVKHKNMSVWADDVKSGDTDNMEARAAAYYWKNLFPEQPTFIRGKDKDDDPNGLLNYGYAILRATVARALVGSGLLPTIGIHHHNRYDAYCLADDIMEPYRPYVDKMVYEIVLQGYGTKLTKKVKQRILSLSTIEVHIDGQRRPLMLAVSQTTASLVKCFSGELRKIVYPVLD